MVRTRRDGGCAHRRTRNSELGVPLGSAEHGGQVARGLRGTLDIDPNPNGILPLQRLGRKPEAELCAFHSTPGLNIALSLEPHVSLDKPLCCRTPHRFNSCRVSCEPTRCAYGASVLQWQHFDGDSNIVFFLSGS